MTTVGYGCALYADWSIFSSTNVLSKNYFLIFDCLLFYSYSVSSDMYPITLIGKMIGSACCIAGIIGKQFKILLGTIFILLCS